MAAQVLLGQLRQHARIAVPVALLDRAVQARADLGQLARGVGQAVGEAGQHVFRARVGFRGRRGRRDHAGDLVIDLAVGVGRGRDAPGGEPAEGFAGDFRRVLGRAGHVWTLLLRILCSPC
jgi:hypothetical protein